MAYQYSYMALNSGKFSSKMKTKLERAYVEDDEKTMENI